MFIQSEILPFDVPRRVYMRPKPVLKQDGFHPNSSTSIRDIPSGVLSQLCDHFRESVFEKAGVPDPRAAKPEAPPAQSVVYKVLGTASRPEFDKLITEHLRDRWQLVGGPFYSASFLNQAMIYRAADSTRGAS